tara:strand:+ start:450 stop:635 length:186 start_codon:yes stop_codon:yes gene_type:complete
MDKLKKGTKCTWADNLTSELKSGWVVISPVIENLHYTVSTRKNGMGKDILYKKMRNELTVL